MTGDQALSIVELAILRVRDRHRRMLPHSPAIIEALDHIAEEIAKISADHKHNRHEQSPRKED